MASQFLLCAAACFVASSALDMRAPAVPLAVSTPFVSIWSFTAGDLAQPATFWHGETHTLESAVRVDGVAYALLGAPRGGVPAASQHGFPDIAATSSTYAFTAGAVQVTLRFTTPHLPEQLEVAARPASIIAWTATSMDGAPHTVQVYLAAGAEVVAGAFPGEAIEWDRPPITGGAVPVTALRIGQVGQKSGAFNYTAAILRSQEPHQSQDYGFVYVLAQDAGGMTSVIASPDGAAAAFTATGALPGVGGDAVPPMAWPSSGGSPVVAALAWDLGSVSPSFPRNASAVFFVDEVVCVLVHGTPLSPYWRRAYPVADGVVVPVAPLADAVASVGAVLLASDTFDASLRASLLSAGGDKYAATAQLVYRQVFGANGYAWNGSALWAFQKEISSDGDMSTLDVIFPSSPQPLAFANASLLAALLEPELFQMAGYDPANRFDQPCAMHSLGKWPNVDCGNGGCSMPMESTGDILLMSAAVSQARGGDSSFLAPYMRIMRNFAQFCSDALPFPAPQDMTDDFSHAPGNLTNLALKCILGVGAQAYIEQTVGNTTGAKSLYATAQGYGAGFASMGWVPGAASGGHFKFIYNTTWDDSYGLMYNALWARLLGVEWLIPGFYPLFNAHYDFLSNVTVNATWCTPLSSIEHDSKFDWLSNTAALMYTNGTAPSPSAWSMKVFNDTFFFANTTSSRFPLTDHPECVGTYPPAAAADRARPVLGAFFAPLLIAQPSPNVVKAHADLHAFIAAHMGIDAAGVAWTLPA